MQLCTSVNFSLPGFAAVDRTQRPAKHTVNFFPFLYTHHLFPPSVYIFPPHSHAVYFFPLYSQAARNKQERMSVQLQQ